MSDNKNEIQLYHSMLLKMSVSISAKRKSRNNINQGKIEECTKNRASVFLKLLCTEKSEAKLKKSYFFKK